MNDLLDYLIKSLVSDPEAVTIESSTEEDGTVLFEIDVSPVDRGMVIGKSGATIKAIRTLVKTRAIKENKRVNVRLIDDELKITDSPLA